LREIARIGGPDKANLINVGARPIGFFVSVAPDGLKSSQKLRNNFRIPPQALVRYRNRCGRLFPDPSGACVWR
jgi:hypothetical protein